MNTRYYDAFRNTPMEARRAISAGRLKGFTDINPMWRFKRLTEVFGPCGIGWKYEIVSQRLQAGHGNEVAAFVDILLYYKDGADWSAPVPGVGGSMFVAQEKNGPHTSDEAFKMALTDAIGTACKALGMSADIYYANDRTKYSAPPGGQKEPVCAACGKPVTGVKFPSGKSYTVQELTEISAKETGKLHCGQCLKRMGHIHGN